MHRPAMKACEAQWAKDRIPRKARWHKWPEPCWELHYRLDGTHHWPGLAVHRHKVR